MDSDSDSSFSEPWTPEPEWVKEWEYWDTGSGYKHPIDTLDGQQDTISPAKRVCRGDGFSPEPTSPSSVSTSIYVPSENTGNTTLFGTEDISNIEKIEPVDNIAVKASTASPCRHLVPPPGQPEVWAIRRQSLCEALPYYRSYKGSLYAVNGAAAALLVDKYISPRDKFLEQVIIATLGGDRERDPETGEMIRLKDARDNAPMIKAIRKAEEDQRHVVIIAGEGNPLYPCRPPRAYCVLDYFQITDVWAEKVTTKKGNAPVRVWRVRYEKLELDKPSWWWPTTHDDREPSLSSSTTSSDQYVCVRTIVCKMCNEPSKEIYTVGWTCLNYECNSFFDFGRAIAEADLMYSDAFLQERTYYSGAILPLKPEVPDLTGMYGTEFTSRGGVVCPKCGCCNSRLFWNRWTCENCPWTMHTPILQLPASILKEEVDEFDAIVSRRRKANRVPTDDPLATRVNGNCIVAPRSMTLGQFQVRQYFLPDSEGKVVGSVTVFRSNDHINSRENGPDNYFRDLSSLDIGLRRNPAAIAGHKLEGLTRHFQQNFGAMYKFGVTVQSKGFDEAPEVILKALHRLRWAGTVAVQATAEMLPTLPHGEDAPPPESNQFNELLALGYMEKDEISYHDDGEDTLGPTVATLSLGSPSTMRFRPKLRSGFGDKVRLLGVAKRHYQDVLELPLKHGDMVVMHGTVIQKLYEHAVEPRGTRRFALTCRYIHPEKMPTQEDRDAAVIKGAIPLDSYQYIYNGDV